jgi:hypothetical protein
VSKGIVGIIANDFARASLFTACIFKLDVPEGWQKEMLIGGDWCSARNDLCRMLLNSDHQHLWFMDDDHAFPRGFLLKLLAHEKDLVMPICLTRTHPFAPVQYTTKVGPNQYLPIPLSESDKDGLVECEAGGAAGMLIHRRVIEAIEPPWFEYADRSEDIIFCEKAKAAGFKLYADLDARLGHITTTVVHPTVRGEDWMVALTIGQSLNLVVDTADTVVSEESPGAPAQAQTWIWELRRVVDGDQVYVMLLPAGVPFNWQPGNGHAPSGVFQWYCDEGVGEGPKPVGDSFSYKEA